MIQVKTLIIVATLFFAGVTNTHAAIWYDKLPPGGDYVPESSVQAPPVQNEFDTINMPVSEQVKNQPSTEDSVAVPDGPLPSMPSTLNTSRQGLMALFVFIFTALIGVLVWLIIHQKRSQAKK